MLAYCLLVVRKSDDTACLVFQAVLNGQVVRLDRKS